jgi:hypothetical protein
VLKRTELRFEGAMMGREESKEAGIAMMRWVVVERVLWMIYETRDEDSQAKERKGEAKAKMKKRVRG